MCVACKNTNQLQNSIDLQQQTINEMQNRIHKLELEQEQTRQNMETLQRDYKKATEEIKKYNLNMWMSIQKLLNK